MKLDALEEAAGYLMSRDDALERLARLNIDIGEQLGNDEIYLQGISDLYRCFLARPTSMLLYDLMGYSEEIGDPQLRDALGKYAGQWR
jgi:hypothetical protein